MIILDRTVKIPLISSEDVDIPMARPKEFDPDKALEKAMHLFWLQGYEATSVQNLCDHMGIQKGSFYDTFGDKRSLFLAALDRYLQKYGPEHDDLNRSDSAKSAIEEIFRQIVDSSVNDVDCRGCFVVNTIVELAHSDPSIARMSSNRRQEYEGLFHDLLIRARDMGEIPADRDLRAVARFLTNAIFGLRVTAKATRERAVLEDIVSSTLSILD